MKTLFSLVTVISLLTFNLYAEEKNIYATPVQLSLLDPVQLAPANSDVYGLRLTLPYGVNNSIFGLDVGFLNVTKGSQYGLQIAALAAFRSDSTLGLNIGGIANFSTGKDYGASIAGIYNQADGKITGLQLSGIMAKAKKVTGLQLSLINYCDDLTGVQLGLVNICKSGAAPFMLFINAKY